jgi:predicted acetyltransferase
VPHIFKPEEKDERVVYSSHLLKILKQEQQTEFGRIVRGDESWFYLYYQADAALAISRDDLPERVKPVIDTEKC